MIARLCRAILRAHLHHLTRALDRADARMAAENEAMTRSKP